MMNLKDKSYEELRALNSQIVAELNHRHKTEQIKATTKFSIGQLVEFTSKSGMPIKGTILKINTKTIKLKTDAGLWSVSPTLLRSAS